MAKTEDADYGKNYKAFKVLLFYSLFGILLCVILLAVFSFLIVREILPEGLIKIVPSVCACICAFIAGLSSSRILGRTLVTGLVQGVLFFIMLYLAGALVFMRIITANISLPLLLSCVAGALLGGLAAAGGKKRRV
ncbi:MAG: TIGR04086 family membrane protein [Clostridiales bacterium]|jgi:putative membrane protein (TIGR04086 family)|nr:TIGR04086 family membrane protein [Clostridiales bacterium]